MLHYQRRNARTLKIKECGHDTKQLHNLINNISGNEQSNPMPEGLNDQDLANSLADLFPNKILNTWKVFEEVELFKPKSREISKVMKFAPMSETDVTRAFNTMKKKSCELDAIPILIVTKLLPVCIPTITKIVNTSLSEGQFC